MAIRSPQIDPSSARSHAKMTRTASFHLWSSSPRQGCRRNRIAPPAFLIHTRGPPTGGPRAEGSAMSSSPRIGPLLAAALGAAWLAATPVPAHAAGDKADAREACKDMMGDRGMKSVDVDDVHKNKKGNVVVEADATRRGNDRVVFCVDTPNTENARIKK